MSSGVASELKSLTGWTQTTSGTPGWYLTALAQILGLTTTSWAATEVLSAWEVDQTPESSDAIGADLGILAVVVAGVAAYYSSTGGATASMFFDTGSLILDGAALTGTGGLTGTNIIVAIMDGAAFDLDTYTVLHD
jgi:hypothetical protein